MVEVFIEVQPKELSEEGVDVDRVAEDTHEIKVRTMLIVWMLHLFIFLRIR